jgi:hypothetical protein
MNYRLGMDNQVRLENGCLSTRKHFKYSKILTRMILKRLSINQLLTLKYNKRTPFRSTRHTADLFTVQIPWQISLLHSLWAFKITENAQYIKWI